MNRSMPIAASWSSSSPRVRAGGKSETVEAAATGSKYDSGPRAAEFPVEPALAATGEKLFKAKGAPPVMPTASASPAPTSRA